jgi:hypothetical protein
LIVFLSACSSQSSEGVPVEDAVDTTDTTPETSTTVAVDTTDTAPETSTTVVADSVAAVDEGKAACAEFNQARAAYAVFWISALDEYGELSDDVEPDDVEGFDEVSERLAKARERLDAAIEQIEVMDGLVIPIEELQRYYVMLQRVENEVVEIDTLPDYLLFTKEWLVVCNRISQYR